MKICFGYSAVVLNLARSDRDLSESSQAVICKNNSDLIQANFLSIMDAMQDPIDQHIGHRELQNHRKEALCGNQS